MSENQIPTYAQLWHRLTPIYEAGEAKAIVRRMMEECFGLSLADLLCDGMARLDVAQLTQLEAMMRRLEKAEPLQYVLGYEWFMGRRLQVGPGVLIPRPETEVLCQWVIERQPKARRVLDVGCGSGCIAVSLALALQDASVTAWDIASEALRLTRLNAEAYGAKVTVERRDILLPDASGMAADRWDVVVSNPPYICESEASAMHPNVTGYEPSVALFVPDDHPLLFYEVIARYAASALKAGGALYFECHERYADDVAAMLRRQGYAQVETRPDQYGKPRFVRACPSGNT